jgi:hypothetical protein
MRSRGRIAAEAGDRAGAAGAHGSSARAVVDRAGGREGAADDRTFVRSGRARVGVGLAFFGAGAMIPNEVRFGMLEDLRS